MALIGSGWSQDKYMDAMLFAATAHKDQKVPGRRYSYVVHLAGVAMEVIGANSVDEVEDPDLMVQCALLHDVLEDTEVTYEEVATDFGSAVADGVLALSKNTELPKKDQIPESLMRILLQPKEVQMVKLGDRITNMRKPPYEWTREKRIAYRADATLIYEKLKTCSEYLSSRLKRKIEAYSEFVL
jgi:(p)ppGpp synthase/HD superfamily hydrolase